MVARLKRAGYGLIPVICRDSVPIAEKTACGCPFQQQNRFQDQCLGQEREFGQRARGKQPSGPDFKPAPFAKERL
jgi:hypothetical protein